ncbi:hypothetical protein ISS30_10210 [bacterium]|nr:hypothetical protein [bacterium]
MNSVNANGDSCDAFFNIFEDPLFYSTFGDSAFYLTENSPCIDAGDPESPLDPDSTIADIGAIYYNKAPAWIVSSQDSLFFPPLELGMDSTLALLFNNPGNDTLEFYEITTSNPVFTIDFPAISAPIPPGGTSDTCRVTFTPEEEILYEDTLFVLCNAFNAVNDTFVVYLHGEGGIVPDTVRDLTIESIYPNAVLNWSPVTASIYGSPIIVNCYLIFFSEEAGGPFYFLDVSFDTTYTHDYVVQFSPSMFYNVEAYIGEIGLLEAVSAAGERLTRSEVYELLK